jgi:beta-glucosidase
MRKSGFRKVFLLPDEEKEIELTVGKDELGFYNNDMEFVIEPGAFKMRVGPDSARGLEAVFTVSN